MKTLVKSVPDPKEDRLLKDLIHERIRKYGDPAAHIHLNQSAESFLEYKGLFVKKYIRHDDIHDMVAFTPNQPLYKRILITPETMCSKSKFEDLTLEEQLNDVREEAMVIALERYVLPGYGESDQSAYSNALRRICTSLTKGWFRDFAIEHYPELKLCPKNLSDIAKQLKGSKSHLCPSNDVLVQKFVHSDSNVVSTVLFNNFPSLIDQEGLMFLCSCLGETLCGLILQHLPSRRFLIHNTHDFQDSGDCHGWAVWYLGVFELEPDVPMKEIMDSCASKPQLSPEYDRVTPLAQHSILKDHLQHVRHYAVAQFTQFVFSSHDSDTDNEIVQPESGQASRKAKRTFSKVDWDHVSEALKAVYKDSTVLDFLEDAHDLIPSSFEVGDPSTSEEDVDDEL